MIPEVERVADEQMAPAPALLSALSGFPALSTVVNRLLVCWPEHLGYLTARFVPLDVAFETRMEEVAERILRRIGDDLDGYCDDYRWMCDAFVEEEIFFRRHKRYRCTTFAEALEAVYSRDEVMGRYVRGILVSQLIWAPHARSLDMFRTACAVHAADTTFRPLREFWDDWRHHRPPGRSGGLEYRHLADELPGTRQARRGSNARRVGQRCAPARDCQPPRALSAA